jgi:lipopolysaccharide transport system ATP-binding protein
MPAAIVVENVFKKFLIGTARYSSLRDVLTRPLRRLLGRSGEAETARTRDFWALKDVSFEVEKGTTLGIIGPNGAGKSTLLKLISHVSKPTSGRITTRGRVSALIEVGAGFHPELTGRENVYLNGSILGMTRKEIDRKFDAILDFSGIEEFIDTPVKYYSSGMFARLGFSVAAHVEPEILLVDEVLSVGDWHYQQKCLERMDQVASGGVTVVFVSHNMSAVSNLCKRGIFMRSGRLDVIGDVAAAITAYQSSLSESPASEETGRLLRAAMVSLTNGDGRDTRVFNNGTPFVLTFDLTSPGEASDLVAHVQLYDERGNDLFGTDTRRAGTPLGTIRCGERKRLVMTGRMNLLGGNYRFEAFVKSGRSGELLMPHMTLAGFAVEDTRHADGLVDLDSSFTVLSG